MRTKRRHGSSRCHGKIHAYTIKIVTFFGKTSKSYKKVIPNASSVNGANNPSSISAMWKTHFESLLNNVTTDVNMQNVKECVNNTGN